MRRIPQRRRKRIFWIVVGFVLVGPEITNGDPYTLMTFMIALASAQLLFYMNESARISLDFPDMSLTEEDRLTRQWAETDAWA